MIDLYYVGIHFYRYLQLGGQAVAFFYSSLLGFWSGFCRLTFKSPLEIVTSVPLWSPSITVARQPKANSSPTAPQTEGSTCPVGGRKNDVTSSITDMVNVDQKAGLDMFL